MTDPNEQYRTKDPVSDDVSSAKEEDTGAQLESPAEIVTQQQQQQQQQQAAEDDQVTLLLQQQPISTTIHKEGTFKLPPISNILSSIDQFQSSKQLEDSKLLLELCASNSEAELRPADSESSSVHQQAPTSTHPASLIASPAYSAFSPQDNNNSFPPQHLRSESTSSVLTDELETRSPSPIRSPSSFTSGLDSVSTTRQNSNVSLKNERDSSEESLDASSDSGYSQGNKKRTNLPRETIKILNEWILRNIDNPYPNHSQKRILLDRTGLSNVQLSNWFINKRRRRIFSNLSGNNGQPIKKKRLIDRI